MKITFACQTCTKVTTKRYAQNDAPPKYCSQACRLIDNASKYKVEFLCKTCSTPTTKRYSKNRKPPQHCSRECLDADKAYQVAKSQKTALARFPYTAIQIRTCEQCDTVFVRAEKRPRRFCSHSCSVAFRTKHPQLMLKCEVCNSPFKYSVRENRPNQRYCSQKCAFSTQEKRDIGRVSALNALKNGVYNHSLTAPVKTTIAVLISLKIAYIQEWVCGPYAFDLYLPQCHKAIEVHGDFWHANPHVYRDGPLYPIQKNRVQRDKRKATFAKNHHIPLLVLWEFDLKNHLPACIEQIHTFTSQTQLFSTATAVI